MFSVRYFFPHNSDPILTTVSAIESVEASFNLHSQPLEQSSVSITYYKAGVVGGIVLTNYLCLISVVS